MQMLKRIRLTEVRFLLFYLILSHIIVLQTQAQETKLGDKSDGSRSIPIHLIDLYDADSSLIRLDDHPIMPFSTKQTCIPCHNYHKISTGWHFNAADTSISPGRPGHPWILVDQITATQIPLTSRRWPGTFRPEDVGLTPWYFIQQFGRHLPGGGVGENDTSDVDDVFTRWMISGKLEINCLSCHDAEASHNQAEYGHNITKQNFRWAAAATSGFSIVRGSAKDMPDNYDIYHGVAPDKPRAIPPSCEYNESRFNPQGKVFFDLVRHVPNDRCYFCHSTKYVEGSYAERWLTDEDVHLAAGLKCVDCHRNGLDHDIIRGYEGEAEAKNKPSAATFSCKGCHIGDNSALAPRNGRLGAPHPKHTGIPTIHFEKLSCTACHSGPWPSEKAHLVKTSKGHGLGTQAILKSDEVLPYILSPVYVKGEDGKIAPHKLLWPAYWAIMNGDSVRPLAPQLVRPIALTAITSDTMTDSSNYSRIASGKWPNFTTKQLTEVLDSLASLYSEADLPVYISGGQLYRLTDSGEISKQAHLAAQPYSWTLAHDVRPAKQALGNQSCDDCHSMNAAFSFGKVDIHSPLAFERIRPKSMTEFQDNRIVYPKVFAATFFFRPLLKFLILTSCILLAAILILYLFKGLDFILKSQANEE